MNTENIENADQSNNAIENLILDGLNNAIKKTISYDPNALKKLSNFDDKVIKVILENTPFEFYLHIHNSEFLVLKNYSGHCDTAIKGSPLALFTMNFDSPVAGIKNVEINGDATTGQFVAKWLKNLRPDWEEAWCELLGDGMGVRVSNLAKGALDFALKLKDSIINDTQEYLVEESRDLISPTEMEDFLDDVDDLKSDTERLAHQIMAMKKSLI